MLKQEADKELTFKFVQVSVDCIGGNWHECLPYNEETAKLIGTEDSLTEKY